MIQEAYCSKEVSILLKDKGFNEPIWTRYDDEEDKEVIFGDKYDWNNSPMGQISAPTHQMAMAWLREVHEIQCVIMYRESGYYEPQIFCYGEWINEKELDGCFSYEDAVEAALKYLLENLI